MYKWAFFILFTCIFQNHTGQTLMTPESDVFAKFKRFTTDDGLSNMRVTCILQDKNGYLWIGTANGLNKFNGYTFKNYFPDTIKHLPGATIMDLKSDKKGRIWTATPHGLCYYDRTEDRFYSIAPRLPDSHIRSLMIDDKNQVWAHTKNGYLICYNQQNKALKYWKGYPVSQPYYLYDALFQSSDGLIYFGGRQCGPYVFDPQTEEITSCNNCDERHLSDVTFFYEGQDKKLWMGGIDGLFYLDQRSGKLVRNIRSSFFQILDDKKHRRWMASGSGLIKISEKVNKVYYHNEDIEHSISSNHINCLSEDNAGNIWIGTDAGLNLYLPENEWLTHIDHHPGIPNTLSSNRISCAIQLEDGKLWMGTQANGINTLDLKTFHMGHIEKSTSQLASNYISDLYQDSDGILWIGLWSGTGFQRYNKKKNSYELIAQDPNSTQKDWYTDFIDADKHHLWVASWGGFGLMKMPKTSLQLPKNKDDNPYILKFPSRLNTSLLKDSQNLYVGTSDTGLYVMDIKTEKVITYRNKYPEPDSLWGAPVTAMAIDQEGQLWVTAYGLNCWDKTTKTFSHYLTEKPFKNLTITSIIVSKDNKLWMGSNQGIIVFDPKKKKVQTLNKSNKLPFNKFSKAAVLLQDGRMLFGGENGALLFQPEKLLTHQPPQHCIHISSITEFDQEIYHDATITNTYHFDHHNKHLTFHLANLSSYCQMEHQYEYKIEGFHQEWITTERMQHSITISNLKHGNYTLLIKEKHNPASTSSFNLVKKPAFYETLIFWILLSVLVLGAIALYFFIEHQRVLAQNKAMIAQQRLLRSQMNPHFIFNAISAIQNDILKKPPKESVLHLNKFAALIRQFLESSRTEWITVEREIKMLNNYMAIQQLRYSYKFTFSLTLDKHIDPSNVFIPPLISQPIIENAIEHGIKKLTQKGHIIIAYQLEKYQIVVTIEDNGVGIKNNKEAAGAHNSFALDAIKQRLKIIHKKEKSSYLFEIKNINPSGTRVRYTVPYKNKL